MTDNSGTTCHERKCLVCTRVMRSGDNYPGMCHSCHGCRVDHKCDICSEWTDEVWTSIVEHTKATSSTLSMSTDSPSLLTEPGGSSKRPCSRSSSLSCGSFHGFFPPPSPERFREGNRDLVMAEILRLLRHQQNPQPIVISPSSVNVPGTVNAIVLTAVTIARPGFRCRALRPSIPRDVIAPMAMFKTCDVSSAPIMSASGGPAMGHIPSTPSEWNSAGGLASTEHPVPEVNSPEYHIRHWAGHPEPEIISSEYCVHCRTSRLCSSQSS